MLTTTQETAGTSLQGYVKTTRATLTAVLGEPMLFEDSKVTIEWGVRLGSTVATVYDWKRETEHAPEDNELMIYNIGGFDTKATNLIVSLVDLWSRVGK